MKKANLTKETLIDIAKSNAFEAVDQKDSYPNGASDAFNAYLDNLEDTVFGAGGNSGDQEIAYKIYTQMFNDFLKQGDKKMKIAKTIDYKNGKSTIVTEPIKIKTRLGADYPGGAMAEIQDLKKAEFNDWEVNVLLVAISDKFNAAHDKSKRADKDEKYRAYWDGLAEKWFDLHEKVRALK